MKHILITGASSGLGAALAEIYAAPNVIVSLHGRNKERLNHVAERVRQRGAMAHTATGDVTDAEAIRAWIAEAHSRAPIDLLIANAGISGDTFGGDSMPDATKRIFAINLQGVINTLQPALPLMKKRGQGQVALISSLASFRGFAGAGAYCASKAAVRVYGEALRAEMQPLGVGVTVVCPGFIKTPMTDVNPFPMPFLMDANQAAALIKRQLAHNPPRIAFPWPMAVLVRLAAVLPQDWVNHFSRKAPRKPAFDAG